jgi:hypothetical protein
MLLHIYLNDFFQTDKFNKENTFISPIQNLEDQYDDLQFKKIKKIKNKFIVLKNANN